MNAYRNNSSTAGMPSNLADVPNSPIPYGRQCIDQEDMHSVLEALSSDYLTTGPKVAEFENALAHKVGTAYAVAVNSGTAALHCAMYGLGIGPGDEVIVPSITFAATANCVVYRGGIPVFADVDPHTLLLDPEKAEAKITARTKALIGVDYAGQPCDWDALHALACRHNLSLVADSCHALGAAYKGRNAGTLADVTAFSFHPVKHITTGEGGMVTTNSRETAQRMRQFRNHGISADHHTRAQEGTWCYDMVDLGFNYRITDFQCALGISQLKKLDAFLHRRREIAAWYSQALLDADRVAPLALNKNVQHAYHLFVVAVQGTHPADRRRRLFEHLRQAGILVNVHYIPVHLHTYYRHHYETAPGQCPSAEDAYNRIVSLPIHPGMRDSEVARVIDTLMNFSGQL